MSDYDEYNLMDGNIVNTKSNYETRLHNKLKVWNQEISELKNKADHAPDYDAKADISGQIEEIHALEQAAINKVNELKRAHESAWEHLKEDIEAVWEKLETALTNHRP